MAAEWLKLAGQIFGGQMAQLHVVSNPTKKGFDGKPLSTPRGSLVRVEGTITHASGAGNWSANSKLLSASGRGHV